MRYTRYNLKKKSGNYGFAICVIIILFLSFLIGSIIFKFIFVQAGVETTVNNDTAKEQVSKKTESSNTEYYIVQCGVHSKKENADALMNKLKAIGNPFMIKDGSYYKVFYGITDKNNYDSVSKVLNDNKIDINKIKIEINNDSTGDIEIGKIIDAYLEIINKVANKDVSDVQTESIKKWCSKLEKVDNKYKNYNLNLELKNSINKLPDKINKSNISDIETFVYGELKKLK